MNTFAQLLTAAGVFINELVKITGEAEHAKGMLRGAADEKQSKDQQKE